MNRPKTCCKPHKQSLWFRGQNVTILEWLRFNTDVDTFESVWGYQGWDKSEIPKEYWKTDEGLGVWSLKIKEILTKYIFSIISGNTICVCVFVCNVLFCLILLSIAKSKNRSTEECWKLKSPETRQVQEISTLQHLQVPSGTEPGVRRSKRPLLACRIRCKCSMETSRN